MIREYLSQSVLSSHGHRSLYDIYPDILRNAPHEKFRNLFIYYNQQGCNKNTAMLRRICPIVPGLCFHLRFQAPFEQCQVEC